LKKPDNSIGDFTYGVENIKVFFGAGGNLKIGKFCSFAGDIKIFLGGNHRTDWVSTYPFGHICPDVFGEPVKGHPSSNGNVVIGNDVWIGTGTTIMSGVTIGNGAVICANSHVVSDVADYAVAGGNPARHIKYRFDNNKINKLLNLKWWDLPLEEIKKIVPVLCSEPQ